MDISIIIPTCNREKILLSTLNQFQILEFSFSYEIIVVNNGEPLNLRNTEKINNLKVIESPSNKASEARNAGARVAKGEWLLFLDDDILITQDAIEKIFSLSINNPTKIFFPNWIYPESLLNSLHKTSFGRFLYKIEYWKLEGWLSTPLKDDSNIHEISLGASYFFLIKKQKFESSGGYNNNIKYAGAEDYEYFNKLKNLGYNFFVCKDIYVYHNEEDRTNIIEWLNRKKRDAYTRMYIEDYNAKDKNNNFFIKIFPVIKFVISPLVNILILFTTACNSFTHLDPIKFKIIKFLTYFYMQYGRYLFLKQNS